MSALRGDSGQVDLPWWLMTDASASGLVEDVEYEFLHDEEQGDLEEGCENFQMADNADLMMFAGDGLDMVEQMLQDHQHVQSYLRYRTVLSEHVAGRQLEKVLKRGWGREAASHDNDGGPEGVVSGHSTLEEQQEAMLQETIQEMQDEEEHVVKQAVIVRRASDAKLPPNPQGGAAEGGDGGGGGGAKGRRASFLRRKSTSNISGGNFASSTGGRISPVSGTSGSSPTPGPSGSRSSHIPSPRRRLVQTGLSVLRGRNNVCAPGGLGVMTNEVIEHAQEVLDDRLTRQQKELNSIGPGGVPFEDPVSPSSSVGGTRRASQQRRGNSG